MQFKETPIVYLLTKLWQYSESRKKIVLYFALFFVADLALLTEPLVIALILNKIQANGATLTPDYLKSLLLLVSLFMVLEVIFRLFYAPARITENKNAFLAKARYKEILLRGVFNLPLQWHSEHHSGDTLDKIDKGGNGILGYGSQTFVIISLAVSMIGSFCVLLFFDAVASFVVLTMFFLNVFMIMKFDKTIVDQYHRLNRYENKISEKIVDAITNISTVVILRIEKPVLKSVSKKLFEPHGLFGENARLNEAKWTLVAINNKIMLLAVLGYHLWSKYHWQEPLIAGTLFALYGYTDSISNMFFRIAGLYSQILRYRTAVANSEELSSRFVEKKFNGNGDLNGNWQLLEIKSLCFSYDTGGENMHLEDVNLEIKRGKKIALVGATGSGKTTLLKVIRELYEPERARILLNGSKLENGFAAISSQIALIPQDPEIFGTTILENITLGIDYDTNEVLNFINIACFSDVINKLPKGFNSAINEKGVNLSGGEKQRLALTRGLLACKDKNIVLLDEPTSSIDPSTELQIFQNIFSAFGEKTILCSLHRLHLLPMFDEIHYFENGRIIASGTLDKLLSGCREFKDMWQKQKSAAIGDNEPQNPSG